MKLERIKCKHLTRAWDITVSPHYLAACTGRRAVILSRELELLHTVEGLDYVYSAKFSPDESKLLLISNGNKFYILDMETKQLDKLTIRAPFNCNLEGEGCWSFDGASVLIPVTHSKTGTGTLRRYRADDLTRSEDLLPQRYDLTHIRRLERSRNYLLTGIDRTDDCQYLVYFDGAESVCHKLEDPENMVIFGLDADGDTGTVTLYTNRECRRYSADGKLLGTIPHPRAAAMTVSFSDVFAPMFPEGSRELDQIRATCAAGGLENVPVEDHINKYALSPCGKYRFYGSESGFYLTDARTGGLLAHIPEEYGVQNITPIAPDVIALSTWSGVKLYRITEE